MMRRHILVLAAVTALLPALPVSAQDIDPKLRTLVAGAHRAEANRARDIYRHPLETLSFFGLKEDMKVVEILPGGSGWWTEIIAPYVRERGLYYAAQPDRTAYDGAQRGLAAFREKFGATPALYDKIVQTEFKGDQHRIAPDGSVDMIVSFRNLHNWIEEGTAEAAHRAFFRALKPGGILGLKDHRARPDLPEADQLKAGYVREDRAIAIAQQAGFRLVSKSEANANPKDTHLHPSGVWSLPPTYRLGDQDRAKYREIGESDRFTLKFVKP
jgi:predicted methyltransferase